MDFKAEPIRTTQRKLVSGDNQYELLLRSNNPLLMDIGKLPSDTILDVRLDIADSDKPIKHDAELGDFE